MVVAPRDLFNHAQLLKQLGFLCLYIHNGMDRQVQKTPANLRFENDGSDHYIIAQDPSDGSFYVESGLTIWIGPHKTRLYQGLNARQPASLFLYDRTGGICEVFNQTAGNLWFTPEFLDLCAKEMEKHE